MQEFITGAGAGAGAGAEKKQMQEFIYLFSKICLFI